MPALTVSVLPVPAGSLLAWYDEHRRDLPWRATRDPYSVWVSEVMLQQTRVATVLPYYRAWMERWPTVDALAEADLENVLAAWSGLGYYRRARWLHEAARLVAEDGFPTDAAGWRRLPGVGPYTAAAIASICNGEGVPAIDGNLHRVLARLHGTRDAQGIRAAAEASIDRDRPGDWNQAMMDLGATICAPRPGCSRCPLATECKAPGMDVGRKRQEPAKQEMHFAVIQEQGRTLMVRAPDGLLGGLWHLPGGPRDQSLEELVLRQTGACVRIEDASGEGPGRKGTPVGRVVHRFTHRVWDMRVHRGAVVEPATKEVAWVEDLEAAAVPVAMKKAVAAIASRPNR